MILEIIDDFARLLDFQAEWSAFAQSTPGITPFQLPDWLITWWRHFGSGRLHVLVFRENENLTGVVPCFLHQWNGLRQMTLIGSGISDYLDPLIAPQHAATLIERLRIHLEGNSDWDICNWQDLSLQTPLKAIASEIIEETPCSEIPLTGTFDQYWSARSKSLRQNVRRDRLKAEVQGALHFEVRRALDPETMSALIELHAARWRRHGESGMIEENHSAAFIEEVAQEFAARDRLRIFVLHFRTRIAAVLLGFGYDRTVFNYLTAFDPETETLGLGRTLLFEAIRDSFWRGCRAWNFLRGSEPYKTWWGAKEIPKCRVIVRRTA